MMEMNSVNYHCTDGSQMGKLQCQLNSYYDGEYVLRSMVRLVCMRVDIDPRQCNRMALAVDEMYVNIAKHGYGGKPGRVEFDVRIHRESVKNKVLCFSFRDYAPHVTLETLKRLVSGNEKRHISPGGRGWALIFSIMDRVDHQSLAVGNVWRMVYQCRGVA